MAQLPDIVSVSDLRNKYKFAIERAKDRPLFVLFRNKIVAVLMNPEQYNKLVQENEELKQEIKQLKAK